MGRFRFDYKNCVVYGSFHKLEVIFLTSVLVTRALAFGVYSMAPDL